MICLSSLSDEHLELLSEDENQTDYIIDGVKVRISRTFGEKPICDILHTIAVMKLKEKDN